MATIDLVLASSEHGSEGTAAVGFRFPLSLILPASTLSREAGITKATWKIIDRFRTSQEEEWAPCRIHHYFSGRWLLQRRRILRSGGDTTAI